MKQIAPLLNSIKLFFLLMVLTTLLVGCATMTPLTQASKKGDLKTIDKLLREGADINKANPDPSGTTPLGWALKKCKFDAAAALLTKGANVNLTNGEGSPIWFAVFSCERLDHSFMKRLLDKVADVNIKDKQGITALGWALSNCNYDEASALLTKGANLNLTNSEGTPTWFAAFSCNNIDHSFTKRLLDKVADVNIKDKQGITALGWALQNCAFDASSALLTKGANVNLTNVEGSPIWFAAFSCYNIDHSFMKRLLDKVADVNIKDQQGYTVSSRLYNYNEDDYEKVIKLLSDKGLNVNIIDSQGWTPLIYAVFRNNSKLVNILLDAGANINTIDSQGWTPLMFAAYYNYTQIAKILVERGADININNRSKKNAMSYAKKLLFMENSVADVLRNAVHIRQQYLANTKTNSKIAKQSIDPGKTQSVANVKPDSNVHKPQYIADIKTAESTSAKPSLDAVRNQPISSPKPDNDVQKPQNIEVTKNADSTTTKPSIETAYNKPDSTREPDSDVRKPQYIANKKNHNLKTSKSSIKTARKSLVSISELDIDVLPSIKVKPNKNSYAIVIGIEKYRQKLPRADFATADAKTVTEYLTKVMGYPEENVVMLINEYASKSDLEKYFEKWLSNNVEKDSNVFIYYSGHGSSNPIKGDAYIVPYDGDPSFIEQTGYSLKRLYESLNKIQANEIIVALDSCFSGAGGRSVHAKGTRPLVMDIQSNMLLSGNITVMAAASGNQISSTYDEKGHGLFTYFMLKGIKNEDVVRQDGSISISDLFRYVKIQVERIARKQYNNEQTPQLIGSIKH